MSSIETFCALMNIFHGIKIPMPCRTKINITTLYLNIQRINNEVAKIHVSPVLIRALFDLKFCLNLLKAGTSIHLIHCYNEQLNKITFNCMITSVFSSKLFKESKNKWSKHSNNPFNRVNTFESIWEQQNSDSTQPLKAYKRHKSHDMHE